MDFFFMLYWHMAKSTKAAKILAREKNRQNQIPAAEIIERMAVDILGESVMTSTQASMAIALLRKTHPDLKAIEASIEGQVDLNMNIKIT